MAKGHYCVTHKTPFFKSGKMRGYAHPIKDGAGETIGWCNEDAEEVAKLELRPPGNLLPEHQKEIDKVLSAHTPITKEASIEAQVAIKEIGENWRAGKLKDDDLLVVGYLIWLIDKLNYKEAEGEIKTAQTIKTANTDGQTQVDDEVVADETDRVSGFLKYLENHGIKDDRLWLEVEYGVPQDKVLTAKRCVQLYREIRKKEGW